MKKLLCAMALVPMLVGAGCSGSGSSSGSASTGGVSDSTVIAWVEGENCVKTIVSASAAKKIGYPNGEKDTICISESSMAKLQAGDEDKASGSARVTLGGLVKNADGTYSVNVLTATDVK